MVAAIILITNKDLVDLGAQFRRIGLTVVLRRPRSLKSGIATTVGAGYTPSDSCCEEVFAEKVVL